MLIKVVGILVSLAYLFLSYIIMLKPSSCCSSNRFSCNKKLVIKACVEVGVTVGVGVGVLVIVGVGVVVLVGVTVGVGVSARVDVGVGVGVLVTAGVDTGYEFQYPLSVKNIDASVADEKGPVGDGIYEFTNSRNVESLKGFVMFLVPLKPRYAVTPEIGV